MQALSCKTCMFPIRNAESVVFKTLLRQLESKALGLPILTNAVY